MQRVNPGAKISEFFDFDPNCEELSLRISAPPRDGKANEEACRAVADTFDVGARFVTLVAGDKARNKTFHIRGVDKAHAVASFCKIFPAG
jgi:uncharacterized protein (TIGR00251 family)